MAHVTSDRNLKVVALDFEQRQRAERLVDAVIDDPSMAACELIWLRSQLEHLVGPALTAEQKRESIQAMYDDLVGGSSGD